VIPDYKVNWFSSLVSITLLTSLRSFQMLLDCTDLLLHFVHEINVVIPSLPGLYPIQRSSTLSAIQGFKMSHLDALLVTIVVRELS